MGTVIRKGADLGGKLFDSINKAKKASRELQKTGTKVHVLPHKTRAQFPIANSGLRSHDTIMNKEKAK